MSPETKAAILKRVRKMINLGTNAGATEGERDNAMRMAYATLAKYNLSIAEAEQAGQTTEEARDKQGTDAASCSVWEAHVHAGAANLFFCDYFRSSSYRDGKKVRQHFYVGRVSNIVTAQEMAAWLCKAIHREATKVSAGRGRSFVNSFCLGAAVRIRSRVKQIREQVNAAEPGTALVLASLYQREMEANKALMPKTCTTRGRPGSDREAYRAGQAYGDRVNLNRQIAGRVQPAGVLK